MKSLKVGHYTNQEHGTGVTVFLFEKPAIATYQLCGSAPATRDLSILDLDANVDEINGLVFTGGSAFGLGCVNGVMNFLQEKNIGKNMPHGKVPIVPAAAIYDFAIKSPIPPTIENAYAACLAAEENNVMQGSIGAGTGATVGKLIPNAKRMTGGLGRAEITCENGLTVVAYAVVNAVGDVKNNEKIIAGACDAEDELSDCTQYLISGKSESYQTSDNTTLVVIFTNAKFSKIELKRIAKMSISGIAKAISPVFTRYDGDIVFCVSLGDHKASEVTVGTMAVEVVRQAIVNAVKDSKILK